MWDATVNPFLEIVHVDNFDGDLFKGGVKHTNDRKSMVQGNGEKVKIKTGIQMYSLREHIGPFIELEINYKGDVIIVLQGKVCLESRTSDSMFRLAHDLSCIRHLADPCPDLLIVPQCLRRSALGRYENY